MAPFGLLKHIARDLRGAEAIVRQSPLKWTIRRPPRLMNGSRERAMPGIPGFAPRRGVLDVVSRRRRLYAGHG
jgi:uncharacterized protein YbjT (DUF2867 family)